MSASGFDDCFERPPSQQQQANAKLKIYNVLNERAHEIGQGHGSGLAGQRARHVIVALALDTANCGRLGINTATAVNRDVIATGIILCRHGYPVAAFAHGVRLHRIDLHVVRVLENDEFLQVALAQLFSCQWNWRCDCRRRFGSAPLVDGDGGECRDGGNNNRRSGEFQRRDLHKWAPLAIRSIRFRHRKYKPSKLHQFIDNVEINTAVHCSYGRYLRVWNIG